MEGQEATGAVELVVPEETDKQPLQDDSEVHKEAPQLASGFATDGDRPKVTIEVEEEEESEINMEDSTNLADTAILPLCDESLESNKQVRVDLDTEGGKQMQKQSGPQEHGIINVDEPTGEIQGRERGEPEDKPREEGEEPVANQPSAPVGILKKSNYIVAEKEETSVPPSVLRKGKHKEEEVGKKKVHIWQLVMR